MKNALWELAWVKESEGFTDGKVGIRKMGPLLR